jgi:hypothetical protein
VFGKLTTSGIIPADIMTTALNGLAADVREGFKMAVEGK